MTVSMTVSSPLTGRADPGADDDGAHHLRLEGRAAHVEPRRLLQRHRHRHPPRPHLAARAGAHERVKHDSFAN